MRFNTDINMVTQKSSRPQKPPAISPVSRRLEYVRKREGLSVRAFYSALRPVAGAAWPKYSAAVTYHSHREPPIGYLAAVARRFGYALEWLCTGEGVRHPPPPAPTQELDWLLERVSAGFPEISLLPPATQQLTRALVEKQRELALYMADPAADWPSIRPITSPDQYPEGAPDGEELAFYTLLRDYLIGPLKWGYADMAAMVHDRSGGYLFEEEKAQMYLTAAHQALYFALDLQEEWWRSVLGPASVYRTPDEDDGGPGDNPGAKRGRSEPAPISD